MAAKLFGVLVILAVTFSTGEGIKCYMCNSKMNRDCHNLTNTSLEPRECNIDAIRADNPAVAETLEEIARTTNEKLDTINEEMVCHKGVTIVSGEKITIRGCQVGKKGSFDACKTISTTIDAMPSVSLLHCSLCNFYGCNNSHMFKASWALLVLPAIMRLIQ